MPHRSTYSGLNLWIIQDGIRYEMKIWRNFRGYTYRKYSILSDSRGIPEKVYNSAPRDYATAFVYLRSHFGLE